MIVSGRRLHLDRAGLTRYLIFYVTVILLAWLILLVEGRWFTSAGRGGMIVAVPLVFVLRLAVAGWIGGWTAVACMGNDPSTVVSVGAKHCLFAPYV